MNEPEKDSASTQEACSLHEVVSALALFGLDGDTIFARIRGDIERGLMQEARGHLDFVDVLLQKRTKS